uniref:Cytochrome c oxidase subunit 3 n=1 Tax=Pteromalus puparum TaxID=32389 RepID=A0A3G2BZB1_9HYME|nr:cytochrome c oxidase subunit III [Pteromalus puparum]AYM35236.1 cytochrome c oxidase subunit III [Pteromalus puparum]AZL93466.1 cytochrome c oxidase subunit 3 [Pteromalus puparum]
MMKMYQPFHLVTLSPWPLLMSFSLLSMMVSLMNWFNNFNYYMLLFSMISMILCMYQWWRDVIRESTYQGYHTYKVMKSMKLGMLLFIMSEILFFFSIFWCYFHMFLSPSIEIGSLWPPKNIITFNPYHIPLLNTIILLSSGVTITWCHYSLLLMMKKNSFISLLITMILGIIFSMYQYKEYNDASFTISDSVYGSIFFMATGFHGLHVIIGTLFLMVNLLRIYYNNYSSNHHFGFEAAAWYWHFVDVVWLFLYLLVYFWSS